MDSEQQRLTDIESDVRATSEELVADAARVREIEEAKLTLPPDSPETLALARESAVLTASMASKARLEERLVEDAQRTDSTHQR